MKNIIITALRRLALTLFYLLLKNILLLQMNAIEGKIPWEI